MELNLEKSWTSLSTENNHPIKGLDDTPVPRKRSAIYLGTLLADTVDNHKEIMNRTADYPYI